MPASLKLRPRMQRLLSPAVAQAQLIGIVAWLAVLLINPLEVFDFLRCSLHTHVAGGLQVAPCCR